jgi:hypothetical protein
MQQPPSIPATPTGNWWDRNWKWFVPTACVGALLAVVAFIVLIVSVVFGFIKSSDAYKVAVERAKASPAVVEKLGTPITEGFFVTGNINVSGPSGRAELAIPISGPKTEATIYVEAVKTAGQWSFPGLVVEIYKSGERIDLSETKTP